MPFLFFSSSFCKIHQEKTSEYCVSSVTMKCQPYLSSKQDTLALQSMKVRGNRVHVPYLPALSTASLTLTLTLPLPYSFHDPAAVPGHHRQKYTSSP